MVHVEIDIKENMIHSLVIKGHAESANQGEDLVCAGVSCISVGALNALNELAQDCCELTMKNGYVKVQVNKKNDIVQTILNTIIIQLQTMVESYGEYIQIMKEEV